MRLRRYASRHSNSSVTSRPSLGCPRFRWTLRRSRVSAGSAQPMRHRSTAPTPNLCRPGNGRVAMRVNRDRPETRQRFSIAHEISHTFFPEYHTKHWCRSDGRFRQRNNPDDHLEFLCDTAAAELLLPRPWFPEDAATVTTGAGLLSLAQKYGVSRDATLRRFAETHPRVVAAAF